MADLPTGTVTFLFTDIEGSTRLWEQHPEAMRPALARHDALLTDGIQQHGGVVVKSRGEGDSFFAVFASASAALAAACALQQALLSEPWPAETPLRVRMALHTDTADPREGDYYGPGVNRCARLRAVAHGGQVLLSQATCEGVRGQLPEGVDLRDLGAHRLKDLQQPEHLFQLLHTALPADFPPLRSLEAFVHNLPVQLTRFIGRKREIAGAKRLLANTHLLTLTGAGGCGKTRLALQVAADLVEGYSDGVWLVELAALSDPALVPQTVATALGVREEPGRPLIETLTGYLRSRQLLLVVDNCEHLLTVCAQAAETLLCACPNLRILATSREGLGIAGEQTCRVPSLSLPDPKQLALLDSVRQCEAVQFFWDRALMSQPSFAVTTANASSVVQVCQRLDGIPLAIELAAARVKVLSVEQIAARLDDRFRLLTGGSRTALPRQQTLRAAIDWSYDLLSESERTFLQRLSVFSGGWTLEAAEAVCAGKGVEVWEILDLLTSLVEKSLVLYAERDGEARYRLLETVGQYARDRLMEAGEAESARGQQRDFFLALAERAEPELRGPEQAFWLERLEAEHDNLRTALDWCRSDACGTASELRLAGALWWFWHFQGHWSEGRAWLEGALARIPGTPHTCGPVRALERAKALRGAGHLAWHQGDLEVARSRLEESLAVWRQLGHREGLAYSLMFLGAVTPDDDPVRACSLLEESLAIFRAVVDPWGMAQSLYFLGIRAIDTGDYQAARACFEEGLAIFRARGDRWRIAWGLVHLGQVAHARGEMEPARSLYEEALAISWEVGNRWTVASSLRGLGRVADERGDYAAARMYDEESLAIWRQLGNKRVIAHSLLRLGRVARLQGDFRATRVFLEEAFFLQQEQQDQEGIAGCLEEFAGLAGDMGQPEQAARLLGRASALRQEIGAPISVVDHPNYGRQVAAIRAVLGDTAFSAAWAEGEVLPLGSAIQYALEVPDA